MIITTCSGLWNIIWLVNDSNGLIRNATFKMSSLNNPNPNTKSCIDSSLPSKIIFNNVFKNCLTKTWPWKWETEISALTISHTLLRTLFSRPPHAKKKKMHSHHFQFLQGITVVLTTRKDNGCAKCWRVNKVHYGLCQNGEWQPYNEWGRHPTSLLYIIIRAKVVLYDLKNT